MEPQNKLVWSDKYSVDVALIDDQHKMLFTIINELIDTIASGPTDAKLNDIITRLVQHKMEHFATEEKYFKEFNYEKTDEHVSKHRSFNGSIENIQKKYAQDVPAFAFALVDFLENWLVDHLLTIDQQYKECFKSHGLK